MRKILRAQALMSANAIPRKDIVFLARNGTTDTIDISSTSYLRSRAAVDVATYSAPTPSGTIYYVDKDATGAADGSSWDDAFTAVQAGLNAALVSGDAVYVAAGTYNEALQSKANGVSIVGATGDRDDVVIDGEGKGAETLYLLHNQDLYHLTLRGLAGYYTLKHDGILNGYDLIVERGAAGVYSAGASTPNLFNVVIRDNDGTGYAFRSNSNVKQSFLSIYNNKFGLTFGACSGGVTGSNFAVFGNTDNGINSLDTYTGSSVFTNIQQFGNGHRTETIYPVDHLGSGTITITSSYTLSAPFSVAAYHLRNITDGGSNIGITEQSMLPLLSNTRYPVYLAFVIDDHQSRSFFYDFTDLCEEFGFNCTLAFNTELGNAADYTNMAAEVANGHEIASHTVSHINLTTISDEPVQLASELVDSKAAIEAGLLAAGTQYTVKTLACPYNATDATIQTALLDAGYIGARGGSVTLGNESHSIASAEIYKMASISPSGVLGSTHPRAKMAALLEGLGATGGFVAFYSHDPAYIAGDYTLDQWRVVFEEVAKHPNVQVMTLGALAEKLRTYDPSGDLAADVSGEVYTRTLIDEANYQLESDSPCVSGGSMPFADGDGDQYDAAGYKVWSDTTDAADYHAAYGWSIGAYQYPHAGGNPAKCYYHMEIVSGTTWADLVIKALPFSELVAADDGTLYTALTPNSIDATERATWTGDQFFFDEVRGAGIYDATLAGNPLLKADRYFGTP